MLIGKHTIYLTNFSEFISGGPLIFSFTIMYLQIRFEKIYIKILKQKLYVVI